MLEKIREKSHDTGVKRIKRPCRDLMHLGRWRRHHRRAVLNWGAESPSQAGRELTESGGGALPRVIWLENAGIRTKGDDNGTFLTS